LTKSTIHSGCSSFSIQFRTSSEKTRRRTSRGEKADRLIA
jgi:hypothetical protein